MIRQRILKNDYTYLMRLKKRRFQRSKMVATGEDGNYTEEDVKRAMNSYNSPDEVNRVDWNQVTLKKELIDKIAKLIERKRTV